MESLCLVYKYLRYTYFKGSSCVIISVPDSGAEKAVFWHLHCWILRCGKES